MHRLNQRLDVPPLRFGLAETPLRVPGVPLVALGLPVLSRAAGAGRGPLHDAVDVSLHGLLVEPIEAQAIRRRRSGGARLWYLFNRVEGVDEDPICSVRHLSASLLT